MNTTLATLGRPAITLPRVAELPWGCLVVETRLAAGNDQADIMGAVVLPNAAVHAHPSCPLVWFEWDRPNGVTSQPIVFHATSDTLIGKRHDAEVEPFSVATMALGAAQARTACDLASASNGRASLMHVASLSSRQPGTVKLVYELWAGALSAWLKAIDWPGDIPLVRDLVWRCTGALQTVGVQLELRHGQLTDYISIELDDLLCPVHAKHRVPRLVESLSQFATVDGSRASVLQSWPGWAEQSGQRVLRHGYLKVAVRDGATQAKMYLGTQAAGVVEQMARVSGVSVPEPIA